MTGRADRGGRDRSEQPTQVAELPDRDGMGESAEKQKAGGRAGRKTSAGAADEDRSGFSADAVPLRPAADRTSEVEREERIKLLTDRRLPRLPHLPRLRMSRGVLVAGGLAAVLVVALIALTVDGSGSPDANPIGSPRPSARSGGEGSKLDRDPGTAMTSGERVSPRQETRPKHSARRGHHQGRRTRRRVGPDPRHHAARHLAVVRKRDAVAPEEPVASSLAPEAEAPAPSTSAPVAETSAAPAPAPEPQPEQATPPPAENAPSPQVEAPSTAGPSSVERQFGFER